MDRSWMPIVAGILDVVAGTLAFFGVLLLALCGFLVATVPEAGEVPLAAVGIFFGAIAFLVLVIALLALFGGVAGLRRSSWGWALTGAIAACVACLPLGLPAVIPTVASEKAMASQRPTE